MTNLPPNGESRPGEFRSTVLGAVFGAGLGFGLTFVAIPLCAFVFHVRLNLQSGIQFVDSMLYSMGGGPSVIFVAAFLWALCAGAVGLVLGAVLGALKQIRRL